MIVDMNAHPVRNYILIISIALLLLTVVSIMVVVFSQNIDQLITSQVLDSITQLEDGTGFSIEYGSVFVSLFNRVRINDIRIYHRASDTSLMFIEELELSYSLMSLLFEKEHDRHLYIDLQKILVTVNPPMLEALQQGLTFITETYPMQEGMLIHLGLSQVSILTSDASGGRTETFVPELSIVSGNLMVEAAASEPATFRYRDAQAAQDISAEGTLELVYDLSSGTGLLDLPMGSVSYNGQVFAPLTASAFIEQSSVAASLRLSDTFDAVISYDWETAELRAESRMKELYPYTYRSLISSFDLDPGFITEGFRISGSVSAALDLTDRTISYEGSLELSDLEGVQGIEPISPSVVFSGDADTVHLEELRFDYADTRFTADMIVRIDDPLHPVGTLGLFDLQADRQLFSLRTTGVQDHYSARMQSPLLPDLFIDVMPKFEPDQVRLTGMIEYTGIEYPLDTSILFEQRQAVLTIGDEVIRASIDFSQRPLVFDLTADSFALPNLDMPIVPNLSAQISGSYSDRTQWEFLVDRLALEQLRYGDGTAAIELTGSADQERAYLNTITIDQEAGDLQGRGSLSYDLSDLDQISASLFLELTSSAEVYSLRAFYDQSAVQAELSLLNGELDRIPGLSARGQVSGSITADGTIDDYLLTADLSIENGNLYDTSIAGEFTLELTPASLQFTSPSGAYGDLIYDQLTLRYQGESGELSADGSFALELDQRTIDLSVNLSSTSPGLYFTKDLSFEQIVEHRFSVDALFHQILINDEPLSDITAQILYENGVFRVTSETYSGLSIDYAIADGSFSAVLEPDLAASFTFAGTFKKGRINASSDDLTFDIRLLNELNLGFIDFTGGTASGSVFITGTLTDLEYYGELFAHSITAGIAFTPNDLLIDDLYLSLIGKEIILAPFSVRNKETLAQSQLTLYIDDIIPTSLDFSIDIPNSRPVTFSHGFNGFKMQYTGKVSGDLQLYGFFKEISLDGDIYLNDGLISMFDPGEFVRTPSSFSQISIGLTTGKNLRLVFPNPDLPIISAIAKEGEKISIKADLVKNSYNATGNIGLRGGEIVYFQRNFYIIDGGVDLNISENLIDPNISVTAKIKDFDSKGQKVDIFLTVDNNSLFDLSPTFSSIPNKTLAEISQILGGNIIPSNISGNSDFSTALAVATIATDVIQQVGLIQIDPIDNLEISIRNALKLDLFSIRTQVIQNILLDTIPGDFSSSFTRNPIARYLDNTTIFLGKYITDDMFIQAIIQLSITDEVSTGGLFITDDIGLDVEVSYEWDNPLYYLTLSMQPESFAFTDLLNSLKIGVSWNFTL